MKEKYITYLTFLLKITSLNIRNIQNIASDLRNNPAQFCNF